MPKVKQKKPHVFEHGEAVEYMNKGEPNGLLSPVDRSVLIALDGRMSREEIRQKSGISDVAFVIACQRLLILGLIKESVPGKSAKAYRAFLKPRTRRSPQRLKWSTTK